MVMVMVTVSAAELRSEEGTWDMPLVTGVSCGLPPASVLVPAADGLSWLEQALLGPPGYGLLAAGLKCGGLRG